MLKEMKTISDYLDIGFLQSLLDHCSKAMGLAFVMVDYQGCPITRYSGFTRFCQIGRTHDEFFERCKQCDAHGGLHAVITGQPYIYRCHAGLVDFALPLIFDGTYIASLMGGQIRLSREKEGELACILPEQTDWTDQEMDEAYARLETISYEKLQSAIALLHDLILFIVQNSMRTDGGRSVPRVLPGEEFSFQKRELANIRRSGRLHYFFFVMNILSRLAFQEKAPKTEAVAYDFADIMRYITESGHEVSTLGEELSYVGALLRIRKAWAGDALCYSICAPDQYWGTNCPYMVLEPLVEWAVQGGCGKACGLEINVTQDQGDVLVQVSGSHEGMTLEDMDERTDASSMEQGFSLRDSDRNLKRIFGKRYGISVSSRKDGKPGQMVSFRLPQTDQNAKSQVKEGSA